MQRSAASFNAAHTDLSESIALITATNEVLQDPESVGTLWKTMGARLRGASTELKDLGEEEDKFTKSTSKLRDLVKSLTGFDIMKSENEFKSLYEIMIGIGEQWDKLSDIEQASLGEALAGKRNANGLYAVLNNVDQLKKAYETAENAAGSAEKEQENYAKSIKYSIDRLKASAEELAVNFINSKALKYGAEILNALVKGLGELTKATHGLAPILTAVSAILALKFRKEIFDLIEALPIIITDTKEVGDALLALQTSGSALANGIGGLLGLLKSFAPLIAVIAAAGAAYVIWDNFTTSVEEARDAISDYNSEYQELKNTLESHEKVVEDVAGSYEELAAGVDTATNKNLSLTNEDYQKYLNITKQLGETFPQLIQRTDEYGGYILSLGDNYEYATDKLNEYLEAEKKNYYFQQYENIDDYGEKSQQSLDDYEEQARIAQASMDSISLTLKNTAMLKDAFDKAKDEKFNITDMFNTANIPELFQEDVIAPLREQLASLCKEDAIRNVDGSWIIDFSELTESDKYAIDNYFQSIISQYEGDLDSATQELSKANQQLEAEWGSLRSTLSNALQFRLSDDKVSQDTRDLAKSYISSLTYNIVEQFKDSEGKIDYEKLVDNFAAEFKKLDLNQQIQFSDLFNPDLTPEEKVKIYEDLQAEFKKENIEIPLDCVIENERDVVQQFKTKIHDLAKVATSNIPGVSAFQDSQVEEAFSELFEELGVDTVEEYQQILSIISECEDWQEALQKVHDEFNNINEATSETDTLTDAVSDVNDRLLPQFEELGKLYEKIFNGDKKFDLSGIDTNDLKGLIDTFSKVKDSLNIEPPTEEIEAFMRVVGDSSSTAEETHKAFNNLATAYFDSAVEAGNFSKENAVVLEQLLKEMGIANSSEVVDYYVQLAEAKQLAADNGFNLANATEETINEFVAEQGASDETAKALYILALKQVFLNQNWINEETSIEQVLSLAKAAGIASDAISKLAEIQAKIAAAKIVVDTSTNKDQVDGAQKTIDTLNQQAKDLAAQVEEDIANVSVDVTFDVPKTGSGSAKSAGKEAGKDAGKAAGDAYVEAYEEELKKLDTLKDRGLISEKQYLEKLKALIIKYFANNAKYAEKYAEEIASYMEKLVSHYSSVISGVTTLLSRRITALQKNKDAAIKAITDERDATINALNAEKEAVEAHYKAKMDGIQSEIDKINSQIKAYQKQQKAIQKVIKQKQKEIKAIEKANKVKEKEKKAEEKFIKSQQKIIDAENEEIDKLNKQVEAFQKQIDAINEANQARQDSLNLAKAEYELQRQMNQRSKLVYTGETGQMVYERDEHAVRDAQENLEEQKNQAKIKAIEKKIKALQDEIQAHKDVIAQYEEVIKEHQKIIDSIDEYLEAQQEIIDGINEEIEAQQELIDKLDEMIEPLQEHIDLLQEEKDALQKALDRELEIYDQRIKAAEEMYARMQEEAEAYWNSLIEQLETTKSKWEELAEVETVAKAWSLVAEEMAQYGYTVNDVLNDVPGAFDRFKEVYVNTLSNMNNGTQYWKDGVQYASSEVEASYNKLGSAIDESAQHVDSLVASTDQIKNASVNIDQCAIAFENVNSRIFDLKTVASEAKDGIFELANTDVSPLSDGFLELTDSIQNSTAALVGGSGEGGSGGGDGGASGGGGAVTNVKSGLETLKTTADTTIGASSDEESGTIIGDVNQLGTGLSAVTETKVGLTDAEADDGTLVGGIAGLHSKVDEHVGLTAGEDGETVIGDFTQLGAGIQEITDSKIGSKDASADDGTLDGGITGLDEHTKDHVEDSVTKRFEDMGQTIKDAEGYVQDVKSAVEDLDGTHATITIDIEVNGEIPSIPGASFKATGTAITGQSFNAAYATGSAHVEGTAKVQGDWGVQQGGRSLVGELGQELVVRNGRFFTVGDNGPEFITLQPSDIVFNHLQTRQLLSKKNLVSPKALQGKAFASGSAFSAVSSSVKFTQDKLHGILGKVLPQFDGFTKIVETSTQSMKQNLEKISNKVASNSKPSVTINNPQFTVSGVTGEEVMRKIEGEFEGLMLTAYQRSMK